MSTVVDPENSPNTVPLSIDCGAVLQVIDEGVLPMIDSLPVSISKCSEMPAICEFL